MKFGNSYHFYQKLAMGVGITSIFLLGLGMKKHFNEKIIYDAQFKQDSTIIMKNLESTYASINNPSYFLDTEEISHISNDLGIESLVSGNPYLRLLPDLDFESQQNNLSGFYRYSNGSQYFGLTISDANSLVSRFDHFKYE